MNNVKVAAIQASPVMFNKEESIKKACRLIREASREGVHIVLLPEAFIPAYPRGLDFGMKVGVRESHGRDLWLKYWENAVDLNSRDLDKIKSTVKKAKITLAMGIIEREGDFGSATLYCTLLYINSNGEIIGKHRKLKPTGSERSIWGEGDGSTMPVFQTEHAKVGGLICWENYMPLARMAMYGKGVEIYFAPTADYRDTWNICMQHIAFEGRCFVLGCNQYITKDMYPNELNLDGELSKYPNTISRGGSVIVAPSGKILAGPLYDREGILYAELNMSEIIKGKLDFDVTGHYARPDVFKLQVDESKRSIVTYN